MTGEEAHSRFDVREAGEFMSSFETRELILPTGLIGNDGREIALLIPFAAALTAIGGVMQFQDDRDDAEDSGDPPR